MPQEIVAEMRYAPHPDRAVEYLSYDRKLGFTLGFGCLPVLDSRCIVGLGMLGHYVGCSPLISPCRASQDLTHE